LAFLAAAIGLTTLWVALNTRSWDELEAVLIPPLIVGVAIAAGWACLLGLLFSCIGPSEVVGGRHVRRRKCV
jgi:hypothetical protein